MASEHGLRVTSALLPGKLHRLLEIARPFVPRLRSLGNAAATAREWPYSDPDQLSSRRPDVLVHVSFFFLGSIFLKTKNL